MGRFGGYLISDSLDYCCMDIAVPFFSADAANLELDPLISISRVVRRGRYVLAEEVDAFEHSFAAYCGVPHGVGLASGTDALELALRAFGIGPGDTVMLAANAGFYGSVAVSLVGAKAHYVEIDSDTMTLSVDSLEQALRRGKPKAIIVTHLYGQLADIGAIAELAREHGVAVVEDCAQAHGAMSGGQRAGSFGDVGCFSFYPTKNLGALGDGGMVTCRNDALARKLRSLRQYGWGSKYHNELEGGRNSRLDEVQAAVLNDKLPLLDVANEKRRIAARFYQSALASVPLRLPVSTGADYVAHLYVVRTPQRDALHDFLARRGITSEVHYPVPDHLQQVTVRQRRERDSLARTEDACSSVLSLPCFVGITPDQQQAVVSAVREFFSAP